MQFQIEVITVEPEQTKKNNRGGDYKAINLVYKKDGKIESRAFADWATKELYPVIQTLKQGDIRVVNAEKPEGGKYWNWTAIEAQGVGVSQDKPQQGSAAASQASQPRAASPVGKVVGSNYETPAERQIRQKYIIAQSSISAAISMFKQGSASPADVLQLADNFFDYVMGKGIEIVQLQKKDPRDLSDMADDIPA